MKYIILAGFLSLSFSDVFASNNTVVFPNAKHVLDTNNCVEIRQACSFDGTSICKKKYCGDQINHLYLENFVKEHRLKGRKFASLFELESYVKKNLPPQLKHMTVSFIYKKNIRKSYNRNRINIQLDAKEYISNITIG